MHASYDQNDVAVWVIRTAVDLYIVQWILFEICKYTFNLITLKLRCENIIDFKSKKKTNSNITVCRSVAHSTGVPCAASISMLTWKVQYNNSLLPPSKTFIFRPSNPRFARGLYMIILLPVYRWLFRFPTTTCAINWMRLTKTEHTRNKSWLHAWHY